MVEKVLLFDQDFDQDEVKIPEDEINGYLNVGWTVKSLTLSGTRIAVVLIKKKDF